MAAEGRHSSVTAYTAVRNYNRQLNSFASIKMKEIRFKKLPAPEGRRTKKICSYHKTDLQLLFDLLHRKRNPFLFFVHGKHHDFDVIAHRDHLAGMFDEAI